MLAAPVTLVLTAVYAMVGGGSAEAGPVQGFVLLLLIPIPLGIALIWGSAFLASRPFRAAVVAAGLWLAVSHFLLPHEVVWQLAANVAAGLLAGLALGLRWRLDAALVVIALALLPVIIWAVVEVPVAEQLQAVSDEMLSVLEENLPAGANEVQRAEVLQEERRNLEKMTGLAGRIYPYVVGMGLLGQGGIILALVWFVVRRLGLDVAGYGLPPFSQWRLPFYLVWLLAIGVGLMVTRAPVLATAGLNLALLSASVISVQGVAVQWHLTNRLLSNMGKLFYWLVMGFFFAPLILVSGVVLGLADQWVDLRRLGTSPDQDDGNTDGPEDIE